MHLRDSACQAAHSYRARALWRRTHLRASSRYRGPMRWRLMGRPSSPCWPASRCKCPPTAQRHGSMRVLPIETGKARTASLRIDRCWRPYQGTDDLHDATQAYLGREYALIAQLDLIAQLGARRHILLLRKLSVVGIPCHHARPAAVRRRPACRVQQRGLCAERIIQTRHLAH